MKALLFNGSPRNGNTEAAVEAFKKGLSCEVEVVNAADVSVGPCIACDSCGCESDCVFDDDTNEIIDKICEADIILFATPVYWWGVTAQLKKIIDKMYSKYYIMKEKKKKIAVIAIGEEAVEGEQYTLIDRQFRCICEYLNWDMNIYIPVSAAACNDLAGRPLELERITKAASEI